MGYMRHHAIVVTTWNRQQAERAHAKATELGMQVSEIITSHTNAQESFFVAPDGSKEGWSESDTGDQRRDAFIEFLRNDPDAYCHFAEVELDSDGDAARLGRHTWDGA
jgi:hypothetical protein